MSNVLNHTHFCFYYQTQQFMPSGISTIHFIAAINSVTEFEIAGHRIFSYFYKFICILLFLSCSICIIYLLPFITTTISFTFLCYLFAHILGRYGLFEHIWTLACFHIVLHISLQFYKTHDYTQIALFHSLVFH